MADHDYPPVRVTRKTHRRLKRLAEQNNMSMGDVISRALAAYKRERRKQPYPGNERVYDPLTLSFGGKT